MITIRISLADGRHCDVDLDWLRGQLAPHGLHVVEEGAARVLEASVPLGVVEAWYLRDRAQSRNPLLTHQAFATSWRSRAGPVAPSSASSRA